MKSSNLPDPTKPSAQNLLATPAQQTEQKGKNKEAMLSAIKRRLSSGALMK